MIGDQDWLRALRVLETYIEWDGPLLLTYIGPDSSLYLASWIEQVDDVNRWFYVPVSTGRLRAIRNGTVEVAQAIREPETQLLVVDIGHNGARAATRLASEVDPADFPLPGDRLSVQEELEHVLARHLREVEVERRHADVVDVALTGEPTKGNSVSLAVLRRFFARWEEFVREQLTALAEPVDAEVVAFSPGSFSIRMAGGASSLSCISAAISAAEGEESPGLFRKLLPTDRARTAFLALLDFLDDEALGMRTDWHLRSGKRESRAISSERASSLGASLRRQTTEVASTTIKGVLDTASRSKRLLELMVDERVLRVVVPPDVENVVSGRKIGNTYEFHVNKTRVTNGFGDLLEETYELAPQTQTTQAGSEADNQEAPEVVRVASRQGIRAPGRIVKRWAKRLSRTDALRVQSSTVKYLRLTESRNALENPVSWFRAELFGDGPAEWRRQRWGRSRAVTESAYVPFVIYWPDYLPELRVLHVSYDPSRPQTGNGTASTWIHWDDVVVSRLEAGNYQGWWMSVCRDDHDQMIIRLETARPEWHGGPQPEDAGAEFSLVFEGYWRHANRGGVPNGSGVYCVYAATHDADAKTVSLKSLIYIGEAARVRDDLTDAAVGDWRAGLQVGQELCYSFAPVGESSRRRVAAALRYHRKRASGAQPGRFPFDRTKVRVSGKHAHLDAEITVDPE